MNLPDVIAGAVIGQGTKTVLEKVSPVLFSAIFGQPSAFDQWMQLRGNQRLEDLVQHVQELEAENKKLQQKISEAEKLSPGSGYTKTLYEYVTTPLDEKMELLRNALLNGLYGDYTVDLREHFYKIVLVIQPLDIQILKYLLEKAPQGWNLLIGKYDLEEISITGIQEHFTGIDHLQIDVALDRLRGQELTYNAVRRKNDKPVLINSQYWGLIPTEAAQAFIEFISTPKIY
jgi:hypothetical protein